MDNAAGTVSVVQECTAAEGIAVSMPVGVVASIVHSLAREVAGNITVIAIENASLRHLINHVRGYCSRPGFDVGIVMLMGIDASPDKEDEVEESAWLSTSPPFTPFFRVDLTRRL